MNEDQTVAEVATLPDCHWCKAKAEYDFKTWMGPWAFGCATHWRYYQLYTTLGTGKGQQLKLVAE